MPARRAIIAGSGRLPRLIARQARPALVVRFRGVAVDLPPGVAHFEAEFERLGAMFAALAAAGVEEVVMAGAMHRPAFDPARLDRETAALLPGLQAAMSAGDDGLLRHVIGLFEARGLTVRSALEVAPELCLPPGTLWGRAPEAAALADEARARAVLQALAPLDVGQAAVAEAGMVLGIETLQGTGFLLESVARSPAALRRGRGVLVKEPKAGQDMRVDVPTIGPDTVVGVAAAGLAGIAIAAGGVIVLEQEEVAALIRRHDLFLVAR